MKKSPDQPANPPDGEKPIKEVITRKNPDGSVDAKGAADDIIEALAGMMRRGGEATGEEGAESHGYNPKYFIGQLRVTFYEILGEGNFKMEDVDALAEEVMESEPELVIKGDDLALLEAADKYLWKSLTPEQAIDAIRYWRFLQVVSHYMVEDKEAVQTEFDDAEVDNALEELRYLGAQIEDPATEEHRTRVVKVLIALHRDGYQEALVRNEDEKALMKRFGAISKQIEKHKAGKLDRGENISEEEKRERAFQLGVDMVPKFKEEVYIREGNLVRELFMASIIRIYDRMGRTLPYNYWCTTDDAERRLIKDEALRIATEHAPAILKRMR